VIKVLRIAVAGTGITACLLLIALCVRSYWKKDVVYGWFPFPGYLQVDSNRGRLKLIANLEHQQSKWKYSSKLPESNLYSWNLSLRRIPNFGWWFDLAAPHWFAALVCGGIATVPWIKWSKRFRVRTLLIAMTFVAILLGIIAATS
jgi:hypothetical protein